MLRSSRLAVCWILCLFLANCASPYFVQDPQGFIINRTEVPYLIKALRCELATFVAANNQRTVLFLADKQVNGTRHANETYPHFQMSTDSFGGIALELKVQDTAGLQSGTQFDWKRTNNPTHSHAWNLGPTASDQSTYDALWNFIIPQDTYYLDNFRPNATVSQSLIPLSGYGSFPCYKFVPHNPHPPFPGPAALQDLDGLAANAYPDAANFKRVWVDNSVPLAEWLQHVSTEVGVTSLLSPVDNDPEAAPPAQMQYIFTIQVTGGFDAKYAITSSLWSAVAGEGSVGIQQTSTMTLILNGIEALGSSGVKNGSAKNSSPNPLPVIALHNPPLTHHALPGNVAAPTPPRPRSYLVYPPNLSVLGAPSQ